RSNHGDADTNVGLLAEAERAERQNAPVGLTENLEARMRQRIEHDADLHADRLVGHQRSEVFGLSAGEAAALRAHPFAQIEPSDPRWPPPTRTGLGRWGRR